MTLYTIMVHSNGKSAECTIRDPNTGLRRAVIFDDPDAAFEACCIIGALRIDSAFEGADVVEYPKTKSL